MAGKRTLYKWACTWDGSVWTEPSTYHADEASLRREYAVGIIACRRLDYTALEVPS